MLKAVVRACVLAGAVAILGLGAGAPASATTFTSMTGDDDCFGLGGACPDGSGYVSDLGGAFFDDHSTASDPLGQDAWRVWGPVSFNIGYAGGPVAIAQLDMRFAGVADGGRGPYNMFFNGASIGLIGRNLSSNASQEVITEHFLVPFNLIHANNTVSFAANESGDGWTLDYLKLIVQGSGAPEPAAWALMVMGFGGLGAALRRRKATLA